MVRRTTARHKRLARGCVIRDTKIAMRGLRNMAWGIVICIFSGFVTAILLSVQPDKSALSLRLDDPTKAQMGGIYTAISLNTSQILSRGPPAGNVVSSLIVAVLSGIAIALGQSSGISSALAGCAMSTSLLPPLVNVGLMFGLLPFYGNMSTDQGHTIMAVLDDARLRPIDGHGQVAGYSTALYSVNVCAVAGFAWITFKIKHIGGKTLRSMAKRTGEMPLGMSREDMSASLFSPSSMTDGGVYVENESEEEIINNLLTPRHNLQVRSPTQRSAKSTPASLYE